MAEKLNGWTISQRTNEHGTKVWIAVKNGEIGIQSEDYTVVKSWAGRYGKNR